ncbi:MAG: ABC transporter ATP-binding protein [Dermabacter sp.]|nr:ABC transporter ATP-binding protein [Dermabacter sp.]
MSQNVNVGINDAEDHEYTKADNRASRRRSFTLLRELVRPVRLQMLGVGFMVVVAQAAVVAGPAIIAWGIDNALPALQGGDATPALATTALHLTCAALAAVLTFGYTRQSTVIGQRMLLELRRRVFRHTQRLSLEFHERYTSGRIVSRQTSDMEALRELLEFGVPILIGSSLSMVFTAASIALMDWPTGLVMLVMLLPCLAITVWFQVKSRAAYRSMRTHSARLIVQFVEAMNGIRAVKAFRKEEQNNREYEELSEDYRAATIRSINVFGIYQPTLRLLANLTVAAVLVVGGLRVLSGDLSVGVLLALVLYARRFFQPVDEIASFYNSLQSAVAALEKISALLWEVPSVAEPAPGRAQSISSGRGAIEFTDVSFRYSPDGPLVPAPLNLTIPAGQTVALVGQTGAGKSTIAKLIARFYDVSTGSIHLDGVDLRDLTSEELTKNVVMVTQEAYLFSGTVADNIELGRPGAAREEIVRAAKAIGAHEFIEALPYGYDTDVNKRGGRVSAGQRQLISFARAFLANPNVIILDEATSSLDLPSERLVQEGLTRLLGNRTALIIAHRLSTVMIADRVLVVHDGEVVEEGAPMELVARGGRFAQLHEAWQASL